MAARIATITRLVTCLALAIPACSILGQPTGDTDRRSGSGGVTPTALASGLDALRVANIGDGTISRVDPITRSAIVAVDLGAPVASIAVDGASRRLWLVISELPFGQK